MLGPVIQTQLTQDVNVAGRLRKQQVREAFQIRYPTLPFALGGAKRYRSGPLYIREGPNEGTSLVTMARIIPINKCLNNSI